MQTRESAADAVVFIRINHHVERNVVLQLSNLHLSI